MAAAAVGMKEKGGPNQGPPVERFAGGREERWCAHFVATLFREAGRPLPGDVDPTVARANPIARVFTMWRELEKAGLVLEEPTLPQRGDIVAFRMRMSSDPGDGWHCGIVSAVEGDLVQTIEGNSGDAVARRGYKLSDWRIVGFARVPG